MAYHPVTREEAIAALYTLLAGIKVGDDALFKFTSRKWENPDSFVTAPERCPALVFDEAVPDAETYDNLGIGIPPVRTERLKVCIYTYRLNEAIAPAIQLNNTLQALKNQIQATDDAGDYTAQTLGGLVANCVIEGNIVAVPGDIDGLGMAIVPVSILMP